MSAITTQYDLFSGPGFLTLLNGGPMIGPAPIEYLDANGDWNWLYDENRLVMIGPKAETISVNTTADWRVASSYSIKDDPAGISFSFYNAELLGQPDHGPFATAGNPWRPRPHGPKGLTTYYHAFVGSGVLVMSDPGSILSRPIVEISDGANWKPYLNDEGVQVGFDMGGQAVEFKSTDNFRVVYQIADAIGADDTAWTLTAYDYVNGYVPPPTTLIPGDGTTAWTVVGANVTAGLGSISKAPGGAGNYTEFGYFGILPANTDGEINYTIDVNGNHSAGFIINPAGLAAYQDIDYTVSIFTGAWVYELGVSKGSIEATLNTGDKITIRRTAGVITYLINDVLKYTSLTPSTDALYFIDGFNNADAASMNNISMTVTP